MKGLLLVAAVLFAYQPAWHGEFVWDDEAWTTEIPGLLQNANGLCSMWCHVAALQQYYPLTGTTFWLDYHLWGFQTPPYHVENILLHAMAALLFWKLLQRFQVPGAWLAAAMFAFHPVMAESVGWIAERKNVLSLVFYLGVLLVYEKHACKPEVENDVSGFRSLTLGSYWLAFALFLCALLSKTTASSLPAVILLIKWWQRGRIRWRMDVLPTLPFFGLSIALCLVVAWLEKNHCGAQGPDFALTFPQRCLIAGHVFWFYIGKLFWPANLCFIYPRWQPDAGSWRLWFYPETAVGMLLGLWLARSRIGRSPATAAFFFVGTLFPVLGFMNANFMRYSFVCDHWVYLSSLGPIAWTAAAVTRVAERLRWRAVFCAFTGMVLAGLAVLTWRQAGIYADNETLWRTTIARNPNSYLANNNMGVILVRKGRLDEAVAYFQKVLKNRPDYSFAYNNIGDILVRKGRAEEAIPYFQKALQNEPNDPGAYNNIGIILFRNGQLEEAISYFQKAMERQPKDPETRNNLGIALARAHDVYANKLAGMGRGDEALVEFEKALEIRPDFADARHDLAVILLQKGRVDEAIVQFREIQNKYPDDAMASFDLGNAYFQNGQMDEAEASYQRTLKIKPEDVSARNNLGMALLKKGMADEAAIQFQKVLALQPDFALARTNLDKALRKKDHP